MRYLPYLLIVLVLILLVLVGMLWLKPDPDPKAAIIAIERELSEEALKEKGMKADVLQALKDEAVDPRILKLALDDLEIRLAEDPDAEEMMKNALTNKSTAKSLYYNPYKGDLEEAFDYRGLKPDAIDVSTEELKRIHDAHRRKVRRYWGKFSKGTFNKQNELQKATGKRRRELLDQLMVAYEEMKSMAKASIFSYEDDGKVRVSIPYERMSSEQREHLKLIKEHIEYARKGHYETKISVQSNDEAVKIAYVQILPETVRGRSYLVQFVIERNTGKRLGISYW